jgi:hypothetical protein
VLHAVNSEGTDGVAPSGTVRDDGSYTITSYDPDDGAPQGQYVATIAWFKFAPELGGAGPNVIPPKYANAKSSPVRVSVSGDATTVDPIIIK